MQITCSVHGKPEECINGLSVFYESDKVKKKQLGIKNEELEAKMEVNCPLTSVNPHNFWDSSQIIVIFNKRVLSFLNFPQIQTKTSTFSEKSHILCSYLLV